MSSAIERVFLRACFGRDEPPSEAGALRRYLAEAGVEGADADAIVAAPRRLGLYRRLLRGNVAGVCASILPVTRRHVDAVAPRLFDATVDAFLDEAGPRTPHLRDVPAELVAFAGPRWRARAATPAYLAELAEVEVLEFGVATALRDAPPTELGAVAVDRALVFASEARLARFAHPVHHVLRGEGVAPPPPGAVALLVYRDAEHATRFFDLSPLAAAIVERALAGAPLGEALAGACAASGEALSDEVLAGLARLLAELAERGVLLGARAPR